MTIKLTVGGMMDASPWEIAQQLGIGYTGDMNPFDHGGTFYSLQDWEKYGYASCVSFYTVPDDDNRTWVEVGTISKPLDQNMRDAFACCDVPEELQGETAAQIEASLNYYGTEPCEDFGGQYIERFTEDQERKAWKYALNHILNLAE